MTEAMVVAAAIRHDLDLPRRPSAAFVCTADIVGACTDCVVLIVCLCDGSIDCVLASCLCLLWLRSDE